jgi:hypothetical protein
VSVVCVLLVIGGLLFSIYIAFIKPNFNPLKTTTQQADQIIQPSVAPQVAPFGCASTRVMQYYQKPKERSVNATY